MLSEIERGLEGDFRQNPSAPLLEEIERGSQPRRHNHCCDQNSFAPQYYQSRQQGYYPNGYGRRQAMGYAPSAYDNVTYQRGYGDAYIRNLQEREIQRQRSSIEMLLCCLCLECCCGCP